MVMSLAYDSDNDTIQAQVAGNYWDYSRFKSIKKYQ